MLLGTVPVSAQQAGAYVAGAEPWVESDCSGDVPVVVASDAKAQSDIYSAITLAGAVGTDCVVLAGPREGDMPAAQRSRLNDAAAGGYAVGGTAALADAKLADRDMTRIGGASRWETAQLIGREASARAGSTPPDIAAPDSSLHLPSDVRRPGVFLGGAEPWVASDCSGDVPIVVGSDAKAQSDIYSAVTLAGVIGTDCVILAGPRDKDMPASQRARLADSAEGGYVVGGIAAVPTVKIAGRDMTRFAGSDRWASAVLVGRRASGDTSAGTATTTETATVGSGDTAMFAAVSVGGSHTCGLRTDGTSICWGDYRQGQLDAPRGSFTAVSAGRKHSCGLRLDGTVDCWGRNESGQADAPDGSFISVSTGSDHSYGVRANGAVVCWGANGYVWEDVDDGRADAPSGSFVSVSAGLGHSCGVRTSGAVTCWGRNESGQADAPDGSFIAVSAGRWHSCGVRTDATVVCWGEADRVLYTPKGSFVSVSAGNNHTCGLRTNGTVACSAWWSAPNHSSDGDYGQADAPEGSFTSVSSGSDTSCGVRANGAVTCWGRNSVDGIATAPSASFTSVTVSGLWYSDGYPFSCGLRSDGTVSCAGPSRQFPSASHDEGGFTAISLGNGFLCGLRRGGSAICSSRYDLGENFAPTARFVAVSASRLDVNDDLVCGVRATGEVQCWTKTICPSCRADRRVAESPTGVFTDVSVGDRHVCGLRASGAVACWGSNGFGQSSAPSGSFTAVSAGADHSCGLRASGIVACWGSNGFGQSSAPSGSFTAVSAGADHSCGLRASGIVACWGRNQGGQADPPSGLFQDLAAGTTHSCAVRNDGAMVCWGFNAEVLLW